MVCFGIWAKFLSDIVEGRWWTRVIKVLRCLWRIKMIGSQTTGFHFLLHCLHGDPFPDRWMCLKMGPATQLQWGASAQRWFSQQLGWSQVIQRSQETRRSVSKKLCACEDGKHFISHRNEIRKAQRQDSDVSQNHMSVGQITKRQLCHSFRLLVGVAYSTSLFRAASAAGCFRIRNRSSKSAGFLHIFLRGISRRLLSRIK